MEGKIFFGVIAKRLTSFTLNNGYIDTSIQKAGVPGFPGYIEHAQMIWNAIHSGAKQEKKELHVVWLDLANAYGSVPHDLIVKSLDFFWVPDKVIGLITQYFRMVYMRFTVGKVTTAWQPLEVGIMMGCVISPLLFVMAMELILRGSRHVVPGVELMEGMALPPMRAFMDDVTSRE